MMRSLLLLLSLLPSWLPAQPEKKPQSLSTDSARLFYGFGFELNRFVPQHRQVFINSYAKESTGFGLQVFCVLRISALAGLRFMPRLSFESKTINRPNSIPVIEESTYISLPAELVAHLFRFGKMRPYLVAGAQLKHDLVQQRGGWTPSLRAGTGIDFHLPYFVLGAEIRGEYQTALWITQSYSACFALVLSE